MNNNKLSVPMLEKVDIVWPKIMFIIAENHERQRRTKRVFSIIITNKFTQIIHTVDNVHKKKTLKNIVIKKVIPLYFSYV